MSVLELRATTGHRGPRLVTTGRAPAARRLWRGTGVLVLLLAFWALLAPPAIGGRTSYVITDGVSMLPKFHAGDLVVLRKETSYHVGEVAAYYNKQLQRVVMHRIVKVHDGYYTFKGDNNSWVDSFEPTKAAIIGAEWLHLPGWGRYAEGTRDPTVAAVLLGALWLVSFYPRRVPRRQRRRHHHAR